MKSTPSVRLAATAGALLALWAAPARAQSADAPATLYRLEKDATYQEGCFPPCLCPILVETPARGTLALRPAGFDGLFEHYEVRDVNWTVSLGDSELRVTGSGKYRIGGEFALMEQLELDLRVGDEPVEHFDSGLVPAGAIFPSLRVAVSIHGQYCYDTVFVVSASPVPRDQIHPYRLQSDSTFQRGCFDLCDCAVWEPLPIEGGFALVDLRRDPLWAEFAVVNVDWTVAPSAATGDLPLPVRGYGTYRVGGEAERQQRLILDLEVGEEPRVLFDSGLVPGGQAFPRLDARISVSGATCLDTIIEVHARPRPGARRLFRLAQ